MKTLKDVKVGETAEICGRAVLERQGILTRRA